MGKQAFYHTEDYQDSNHQVNPLNSILYCQFERHWNGHDLPHRELLEKKRLTFPEPKRQRG